VWNTSHCSCSDTVQRYRRPNLQQLCCENLKPRNSTMTMYTQHTSQTQPFCLPVPCPVCKVAHNLEVISSGRRACWSNWSNHWLSHYCSWTQVNCWWRFIRDHLLLTLSWSRCCWWFGWFWDCLKKQNFISASVRPTKHTVILLFTGHHLNENEGHTLDDRLPTGTECLTLRRLMSYTYGAPILDVSRSHTTTQHSR